MRALLEFVPGYCFLMLCPLGMKGDLNAFVELVSLIRLYLTNVKQLRSTVNAFHWIHDRLCLTNNDLVLVLVQVMMVQVKT